MIKNIIEKMKKDIVFRNSKHAQRVYKDLYLHGYLDSTGAYLPDLEKSVLQEEALIKALIEDIIFVHKCYKPTWRCHNNKCDISENCRTFKRFQLLETITGKKWEEIEKIYK